MGVGSGRGRPGESGTGGGRLGPARWLARDARESTADARMTGVSA